MEDKLGLRGEVKLILRDKDENIIDERYIDNTIVDGGFDAICAAIGNTTQPNDFAWTGIGTGTTGVLTGDTALETEITRVANVYAHTPGTKVFTMTSDYAAGVGTGAITESGLLNAASAGTLLNRVVFSVINKGAADTLQVIWTITLS
jgi:hypothetical protein